MFSKHRLELSLLASGLFYLAFTLPFPLSRYYAVTPPVDYVKLTGYTVLGFVAFIGGILALFGLYVYILRLLVSGAERADFWTLLGIGGLFAVILAFSYPQMAIDLFVYALRTRGWALYRLSPFIAAPERFPPSDPWLGLAGEWVDAASPYGPVWELLSLGAYRLVGGNYLAHLFALKGIGVAAYLGSAWLVYRTLRLTRPRWALAGMAFFALNPLVLFESAQNAHNDIVMVFFLLVAVWAYFRLVGSGQPSAGSSHRAERSGAQSKRNASATRHLPSTTRYLPSAFWLLFVIAFALSILVRFISVLVLPFFLIGLMWRARTWPRRILLLAGTGFAIGVLVVIGMAPYWPGLENWAVLQASRGAGRSLFALLVLTLRPHLGSVNAAFRTTSRLIYALFGGIYLWALWQTVKPGLRTASKGKSNLKAASEAPLRAGFYVFFWYILLAATTFHAWYLLWFLPLAALLLPEKRILSGAVTFSLMALLVIPYYETVRVWYPYLNTNHQLGHLIGVTLLFVPVLLSLWKPLDVLGDAGGDMR